RTSFEPHRGEARPEQHLDTKPTPRTGRQALTERARPDLETLRTTRRVHLDHQSGTYRRGLSPGASMTTRRLLADMTESRDRADMIDPVLNADPIENIDPNEPIEPTDIGSSLPHSTSGSGISAVDAGLSLSQP